MRVLICGSRNYRNAKKVVQRMRSFPNDITVIHGGAAGADSLADMYARGLGYTIEVYKAEMLNVGKPNKVIAFVADPTHSPGTANMVLQALYAQIPVEVHR